MGKGKRLLVGATENHSGKSAVILGMIQKLQKRGVSIAYGKPLGNCWGSEEGEKSLKKEAKKELKKATDEDVEFITEILKLEKNKTRLPLFCIDQISIYEQLQGQEGLSLSYTEALKGYDQNLEGDLILLEGPGNLWEGSLFHLSLLEMSITLEADILLVAPYNVFDWVEQLLSAKESLGKNFMGAIVNDIPPEEMGKIQEKVRPFLEERGVPIFGLLPRDSLLRSVSVRELVKTLDAKVLCRDDRLDLMVESLVIGAMNVSSALEYFRKGRNMAVVTGGDRTELQLAALETSTNCLILTGHTSPQDFILTRAEDLEIPILSVDLDTLSTVEIANKAFGHIRLKEPIKVECIQKLMENYFQSDRLLEKLGFTAQV